MTIPKPVKNLDLTTLTQEAIAILERVYKPWSPCLRQILEYSPEEGKIKCLMHVPRGDYRYTRKKPPAITCIQHDHALAQLSMFFFYFLVRDKIINIKEEFTEKQLEIFKSKFLGWQEKRQLKKMDSATADYFLSVKAAETLLDLYELVVEREIIFFKDKLKSDEDFILEAKLVRRYWRFSARKTVKIPGCVFKIKGCNCQKRECLAAKIYNLAKLPALYRS